MKEWTVLGTRSASDMYQEKGGYFEGREIEECRVNVQVTSIWQQALDSSVLRQRHNAVA
jgi:hypothetical protein